MKILEYRDIQGFLDNATVHNILRITRSQPACQDTTGKFKQVHNSINQQLYRDE